MISPGNFISSKVKLRYRQFHGDRELLNLVIFDKGLCEGQHVARWLVVRASSQKSTKVIEVGPLIDSMNLRETMERDNLERVYREKLERSKREIREQVGKRVRKEKEEEWSFSLFIRGNRMVVGGYG